MSQGNPPEKTSPPLTCVLTQRVHQLDSHMQDVVELKEASIFNSRQTSELTKAQQQLTNSLNNINENLDRGFSLGEKVVSLFGRIVFVFLIVVVALMLFIVYLTNTEVHYRDIHISPRRAGAGASSPDSDAVAPVVP